MTRFTLQMDEEDIKEIKKSALDEQLSPSELLKKAYYEYVYLHTKKPTN